MHHAFLLPVLRVILGWQWFPALPEPIPDPTAHSRMWGRAAVLLWGAEGATAPVCKPGLMSLDTGACSVLGAVPGFENVEMLLDMF